jgi:hypothetical protein
VRQRHTHGSPTSFHYELWFIVQLHSPHFLDRWVSGWLRWYEKAISNRQHSL